MLLSPRRIREREKRLRTLAALPIARLDTADRAELRALRKWDADRRRAITRQISRARFDLAWLEAEAATLGVSIS